MAAVSTVAQTLHPGKPKNRITVLRPSRGVAVLSGYGINVRVERGHLIVEDGVGNERSRGRFSRVGHGLERLVVVGADGVVTLSALRWLADQKASFVMLERDGRVLATTGPVRPSDVRLRRAQALAHQTGVAFRISRELIDRKLAGQERVARESLLDREASELITKVRSELAEVSSIDEVRLVESSAAKTYWKAWRKVASKFPAKDVPHLPEHWHRFDSRTSVLSGSPRLATNPINAILNFLYALLEAECRLALAALGMDPGMGVLHLDSVSRDSLACDLMEPLRPEVDEFVFRLISQQLLKRRWFFEERDGNCRLTADLVRRLAETAPSSARLAAPLAEWVMQAVASTTKTRKLPVPTRLTSDRKRQLHGAPSLAPPKLKVAMARICSCCGNEIDRRSEACLTCSSEVAAVRLVAVAPTGRVASHSVDAEAKRAKTQQVNQAASRKWSASDQPAWLTKDWYSQKITPHLSTLPSSLIARELTVSFGYATEVRRGRVPHPRHWRTLAELVGMAQWSSQVMATRADGRTPSQKNR